jgi:hypothetical protein
MACFVIYWHRNNPFKEHIKKWRELMRMREQEQMQRHKEFVYYDSVTAAPSGCYSFWCCPHYGKITSERVIYSAQPEVCTASAASSLTEATPLPGCGWAAYEEAPPVGLGSMGDGRLPAKGPHVSSVSFVMRMSPPHAREQVWRRAVSRERVRLRRSTGKWDTDKGCGCSRLFLHCSHRCSAKKSCVGP